MRKQELVGLYQFCDYYISTSAGEGFNMPTVQAMSCGIPCLTPRNTAHVDYANDDNSYMLETFPEMTRNMSQMIPYYSAEMNWWPCHNESIVSQFKQAYKDWRTEKYKEKAQTSRKQVVDLFSYEKNIPYWTDLFAEIDHC